MERNKDERRGGGWIGQDEEDMNERWREGKDNSGLRG